MLINWIITLCIVPYKDLKYSPQSGSPRTFNYSALNHLSGQFRGRLHSRQLLLMVYARVGSFFFFFTKSVPNNTVGCFDDRKLISSLGTRLGFGIGKVFDNHADTTRRSSD